MDIKTIKNNLSLKHQDFMESIKDDSTSLIFDTGSIISGGSIASLLLKEKVNDYDYYFSDKKTCKSVAQYYVDLLNLFHSQNSKVSEILNVLNSLGSQGNNSITSVLNSLGSQGKLISGKFKLVEHPEGRIAIHYHNRPFWEYAGDVDELPPYFPVFITDNAITLTGGVQLILRFYGTPEEIHSNFDFVHCTCYYIPFSNKLELPQKALASILTKELVYVGSKYPLSSIIRTRKFIERGWTINAGQYLKMAIQLNELNLLGVKVLKDQLIGVDLNYFGEIIECLEKNTEVGCGAEYVLNLIDQIF